MPLALLPLELPRWDEAAIDGLVVTLFDDERPLRGAAGLCDWRLAGRLSRLIQRGRVSGAAREAVLMPPGRRLSFRRILIVGLGRQRGFDDAAYRETNGWIREVVRRAGMREFAIQPPGRATGVVAARRAIEMWLEVPEQDGEQVYIIDSAAAHKEMADVLGHRDRPRREPGRSKPLTGPA